MRAGGVGGALIVCLCLLATGAYAQEGLLYLNEKPLSLSPPHVVEGELWLVPVEPLAIKLGLEVASESRMLTVRGPGVQHTISVDQLRTVHDTLYAPIEWILEFVDGEAYRIGESLYITTSPSLLVDLEITPEHVTVRLTRFSAHTETRSVQGDAEILHLCWPHAELRGVAQHIRVGEVGLQESILVGTQQGVELTLWVERGSVWGTESVERDDGYGWTLRLAEHSFEKSTVHAEGVTAHDWQWSDGACQVRAVHIEAWRQSHRLQPLLSSSADPRGESLGTLLGDHGAIAGISLDAMDEGTCSTAGCLIIHGVPHHVSRSPETLLAIDLFGRWSILSSPSEAFVRHANQQIPLDGVNRPMTYGEIVAYAPGYVGTIAEGSTGTFVVVKVREDRVVSVYRGPFVSRDVSAMMIVASGDAANRIEPVQLGDPIALTGRLSVSRETYRHVISVGPWLIKDGELAGQDGADAASMAASHASLVAFDWQGGLYFLTFDRFPEMTPVALCTVWELLQTLPTAVKDAVLLSTCGPGMLSYTTTLGSVHLGDLDATTSLCLALTPLTP
jgi:hypothetical protein